MEGGLLLCSAPYQSIIRLLRKSQKVIIADVVFTFLLLEIIKGANLLCSSKTCALCFITPYQIIITEKSKLLKLYYDKDIPYILGYVLLKASIRMLLSPWLCMLRSLMYNARHLELANIFMLENVKKMQYVEACLHF